MQKANYIEFPLQSQENNSTIIRKQPHYLRIISESNDVIRKRPLLVNGSRNEVALNSIANIAFICKSYYSLF